MAIALIQYWPNTYNLTCPVLILTCRSVQGDSKLKSWFIKNCITLAIWIIVSIFQSPPEGIIFLRLIRRSINFHSFIKIPHVKNTTIEKAIFCSNTGFLLCSEIGKKKCHVTDNSFYCSTSYFGVTIIITTIWLQKSLKCVNKPWKIIAGRHWNRCTWNRCTGVWNRLYQTLY